jgi:hypothetical protein
VAGRLVHVGFDRQALIQPAIDGFHVLAVVIQTYVEKIESCGVDRQSRVDRSDDRSFAMGSDRP